jgi:hypothetical protein
MTIILDPTKGITNATWTTEGRPVSPIAGQMGFNSTIGEPEWYDAINLEWKVFSTPLNPSGGGDVALASWPVGSVFISVVATDPNTLLGGGTWEAFGAGRVLVGIDAGQTEFDTVEEVGGAKTHTLTTAQMPSHTHSITTGTVDWESSGQTATQGRIGVRSAISTNAAGSNGAHNNLQPYIVCYFWKRTA